MAIDLKQIMASLDGGGSKKLPPVHLWHPQREISLDILIDDQACWYHEGTVIERQPLIKLLSSILRKDGDSYVLVTPEEKCIIRVTDVPFLVQAVVTSADDPHLLLAITNTEEVIPLDQTAKWELRDYHGVKIPYIEVRNGLFARLGRAVYYQLAEQAVIVKDSVGSHLVLNSAGCSFSMGVVDG